MSPIGFGVLQRQVGFDQAAVGDHVPVINRVPVHLVDQPAMFIQAFDLVERGLGFIVQTIGRPITGNIAQLPHS